MYFLFYYEINNNIVFVVCIPKTRCLPSDKRKNEHLYLYKAGHYLIYTRSVHFQKYTYKEPWINDYFCFVYKYGNGYQ